MAASEEGGGEDAEWVVKGESSDRDDQPRSDEGGIR